MEFKSKTLIGSLITLLAYMYDLISTPLFWILIFFILIESIIWLYKCFTLGGINLKEFLNKIAEKTFVGTLVLISTMVDFALTYYGIDTKGIFHNFIMGALIARELGQIIKSAELLNFWIPSFLKDVINRIDRTK